jgi:hypothetical protein
MMASVYTIVLLAGAAAGGLLHKDRGPGCCDACGVNTARIWREIATLEACPKWRERDDAAQELREFDWRCHPEIVPALAAALLRDCEEEVREEAAESLAKLAPCVPMAHEALHRAAASDPDHATRKWARRALARLERSRCEGVCRVCGPIAGRVPIPVPVGPPDPRPARRADPGARPGAVAPPRTRSRPTVSPGGPAAAAAAGPLGQFALCAAPLGDPAAVSALAAGGRPVPSRPASVPFRIGRRPPPASDR